MAGKIKKLLENELVGGTQSSDVYPVTSIKAVYDEENERLDNIINRRGIVNISTNYNSDHIVETFTLSQAISKVPLKDRVLGFQGKFKTTSDWETYIFIGESTSEWEDSSKWIKGVTEKDICNSLGDSNNTLLSQKITSFNILDTILKSNKVNIKDLDTRLGIISKQGFIRADGTIDNNSSYKYIDVFIEYNNGDLSVPSTFFNESFSPIGISYSRTLKESVPVGTKYLKLFYLKSDIDAEKIIDVRLEYLQNNDEQLNSTATKLSNIIVNERGSSTEKSMSQKIVSQSLESNEVLSNTLRKEILNINPIISDFRNGGIGNYWDTSDISSISFDVRGIQKLSIQFNRPLEEGYRYVFEGILAKEVDSIGKYFASNNNTENYTIKTLSANNNTICTYGYSSLAISIKLYNADNEVVPLRILDNSDWKLILIDNSSIKNKLFIEELNSKLYNSIVPYSIVKNYKDYIKVGYNESDSNSSYNYLDIFLPYNGGDILSSCSMYDKDLNYIKANFGNTYKNYHISEDTAYYKLFWEASSNLDTLNLDVRGYNLQQLDKQLLNSISNLELFKEDSLLTSNEEVNTILKELYIQNYNKDSTYYLRDISLNRSKNQWTINVGKRDSETIFSFWTNQNPENSDIVCLTGKDNEVIYAVIDWKSLGEEDVYLTPYIDLNDSIIRNLSKNSIICSKLLNGVGNINSVLSKYDSDIKNYVDIKLSKLNIPQYKSDCIIYITNQTEFNLINNKIVEQYNLGKRNIIICIKEGVYFNITPIEINSNLVDLSISFLGEGNVKIYGADKFYSYTDNSEYLYNDSYHIVNDNLYSYDKIIVDDKGNEVNISSSEYKEVNTSNIKFEDVETLSNGYFRIRTSYNFGNIDLNDLSYLFLNQSYLAGYYTDLEFIEIENIKYLYATSKYNNASRINNTWVNTRVFKFYNIGRDSNSVYITNEYINIPLKYKKVAISNGKSFIITNNSTLKYLYINNIKFECFNVSGIKCKSLYTIITSNDIRNYRSREAFINIEGSSIIENNNSYNTGYVIKTFGNYTEIKNNTLEKVRNFSEKDDAVLAIASECENTYIHHNIILNIEYGGIRVGKYLSSSSLVFPTSIVEDNIVYNTDEFYANEGLPIKYNDAGALYVSTKNKEAIIRNNIVANMKENTMYNSIYFDDGTFSAKAICNILLCPESNQSIYSRYVNSLDDNSNSCNNIIAYNIVTGPYTLQGNPNIEDNGCIKAKNFIIKNNRNGKYTIENCETEQDELVYMKYTKYNLEVSKRVYDTICNYPFDDFIKKHIKIIES